jgi:hypothetical protein
MMGSKEDFLRTKCIAQLFKSLAGEKTWMEIEGGPHLLLHWQNGDNVMAQIFHWLDARLAAHPNQTIPSGESETTKLSIESTS